MTDFGSRIKNKQKSLVGAINHPLGVANASLLNSRHEKRILLIGNTQVLYELELLAREAC